MYHTLQEFLDDWNQEVENAMKVFAQLTVLMRQAGLLVPGIYGPSREEWSTYGLPPHP
ncbi:MAG: hypothetical protein IH600_11400 [Bacteroidetes bacterium]|nr:hypothetical protein [Bacteroidota bacterium]